MAAYRHLGIMLVLDAGAGLDSKTDIARYHDTLRQHVEDGTVFVHLNVDESPIGYAMWDQTPDQVTLKHWTAPFGDHLRLLDALRKHIGTQRPACSLHPTSAMEVQRAW